MEAVGLVAGAWRVEGWRGEPTAPPRLDAGKLCFDFANTVGWRGTDHPQEFLTGYPVVVAWARYAGVLSDEEAARLRAAAARRPEAAAAAHREAIALRDAIYRLFVAISQGETPPAADLDLVSRIYLAGLAQARLRSRDGHYAWVWSESGADLTRPLWPVAMSAITLLTAGELDRIKVCPGGDGNSCFWLFFDATKNRIRRWCSMESCGSSAKARRQTARRRAARGR